MKRALVIGLLLVGALIGCASPPVEGSAIDKKQMATFITRYVDREAGVVCWTYIESIDCLPIEDTWLDRD